MWKYKKLTEYLTFRFKFLKLIQARLTWMSRKWTISKYDHLPLFNPFHLSSLPSICFGFHIIASWWISHLVLVSFSWGCRSRGGCMTWIQSWKNPLLCLSFLPYWLTYWNSTWYIQSVNSWTIFIFFSFSFSFFQ